MHIQLKVYPYYTALDISSPKVKVKIGYGKFSEIWCKECKLKKKRERGHSIYLINFSSQENGSDISYHGFMSILIIYEKHKLKGSSSY